MNSYELTRRWFDFAFENTDAKVQHTALFCWIIELNNRLGWKEQFGLPTISTMEGLSIGNKKTYLAALNELEKWGFIKIIKLSKNQFQANIIQICRSKKAPALQPALDTALQRHCNGIATTIDTTIATTSVPIDKQRNKETKKQVNNIANRQIEFFEELKIHTEKYGKDMIRKFYDYWSERTTDGQKMRKEMERTWETEKRLAKWKSNNFNNNNKIENAQPEFKKFKGYED